MPYPIENCFDCIEDFAERFRVRMVNVKDGRAGTVVGVLLVQTRGRILRISDIANAFSDDCVTQQTVQSSFGTTSCIKCICVNVSSYRVKTCI